MSKRVSDEEARSVVDTIMASVMAENTGRLVEAGRTRGFKSFVVVAVELTRQDGTVAILHWMPEYGDGEGTGQVKAMVDGIAQGRHLQRGESVRTVTVVIPLDQWPSRPSPTTVH